MSQIANNSAREVAKARRRQSYEKGKAGLTQTAAPTRATQSASKPMQAKRAAASGAPFSSREASLARRKAMSAGGKASVQTADRTRGDIESKARVATNAAPATNTQATNTPAPTKEGCGCGCNGDKSKRPASPAATSKPVLKGRPPKMNNTSPARAASLARRAAMSAQGKSALQGNGPSKAQTARAANPNMSSRDLAKEVRESRSSKGKVKTQAKKCDPCGRIPKKFRNAEANPAAAQDAPWKVGASETSYGQTVTGTMVGRSESVTGDEPSTCRAVTGTEYLGADIFRSFCQSDPNKAPRKVGLSETSRGNSVTGNKVGRSKKVTGDEPGTCKQVTGNEYVGANQSEAFCNTRPTAGPSKIAMTETRKGKTVSGNIVTRSGSVTGDETGSNAKLTGTQYMKRTESKAPRKVGVSDTLRGGAVTGTMVGRSQSVTGDEPGSCRNVTGDDYVGKEQYSSFCGKTPEPRDFKSGVSNTLTGKQVTGVMTGRSGKTTGNEPGTCKAVTGTPYAGEEQYKSYCKPEDASYAMARARRNKATPGAVMTGIQPGIGGKMTGEKKGACEPLTGTPYVGADQFAAACPATPANSSSPDFPQTGAPWTEFSIDSPNHAAQTGDAHSSVTGTRYEQGHITGPFGMATGKITGTEEVRFGNGNTTGSQIMSAVATAEPIEGRIKSRISGEGMDTGLTITGDDWDRGDNVTGTEGRSSVGRNPTRRGDITKMGVMAKPEAKQEVPVPVSKVTGGSGNTAEGAMVTYSGGARG